ncbi:MAG: ATP--guanido phosphotransferase [Clostridia bacterium]|nr:ATP--guanido phosphotransferase [Clostridia bacterium]MDD4386631.1 ATP--guanido phosphotransferase [Clostridia bacterium]
MWYNEIGKNSEYVISTRVRIARNLINFNFPNNMSEDDMMKLNCLVENSIDINKFKLLRLKDMDKITVNSLVQQHLISFECAENINGAIITNKDNSIVIMVNEEDHLRIQTFSSGLNIIDTYDSAKFIENSLNLNYAKNDKYGYLTSCPTNLGSSLRISVMMHLPGLVKIKKINNIVEDVLATGILVRGLYGENTAGYGDMYQFSNKSSFGESDDSIILNIKNVISYLISQESKARQILLKTDILFEDSIFRAYGILKNSRYITYKEAIEYLSKLRVGISLKLISEIDLKVVNRLMTESSSNVLKTILKQDFDQYEENKERAKYLRKELS